MLRLTLVDEETGKHLFDNECTGFMGLVALDKDRCAEVGNMTTEGLASMMSGSRTFMQAAQMVMALELAKSMEDMNNTKEEPSGKIRRIQ